MKTITYDPTKWKLVPRTPTNQMLEDAGCLEGWDGFDHCQDKNHIEWYESIVEAVPDLGNTDTSLEPEICSCCNGRGEIGGVTSDGSWQTDPCPYCAPKETPCTPP